MTGHKSLPISLAVAAVAAITASSVSHADTSVTGAAYDVASEAGVVGVDYPGDGAVAQPAPPPGQGPRRHSVRRVSTIRRVYPAPLVVAPVPPVVVVDRPATVVSSESASDGEAAPVAVKKKKTNDGAVFGFGIRGVGLKQSSIRLVDGDDLETRINGGLGYYIKIRPIRFLSVEFINDYLFGDYGNARGSYVRVPVSLGLQGHVFDYGALDVYGVAAASVSFVSLSDGYDLYRDSAGYDDTHFALFGGQFGVGVSFVSSGFEIGVDVRYTLEQSPRDTVLGPAEDTRSVHGVQFALNVGFGL